MSETLTDVQVRAATDEDLPEILELLRASLGWRPEDPNEEFFRWKHHANCFGRSPAWVAVHAGQVAGYRTFMRWRFLDDQGKRVKAVRAVDTATAPSLQGRGIFRTLTIRGVAELTMAGDDLVFNTPNSQSRPGYLKMGWAEVRRLPVGVLPSGARGLTRMMTSRVPARKWSNATDVGWPAAAALSDHGLAESLLRHAPDKGFRTDRSAAYLSWRTALPQLAYRLLLTNDSDPDQGGLIFRLRQRGDAVEAVVVELLAPNPLVSARLVRRLLKLTGADYAIGLRTGPSAGLLPLPGQGPVLTVRPLASSPPQPTAWALTLGDVELF